MLKMRRQQLGLTQTEVAMKSGVNQSRLSAAERGQAELNEWERAKVAEVLGVPMLELFGPDTKARALYREVRRFMTLEEKSWLFDVQHDPELYQERLTSLAKRYAAVLGTS
jgi:transcriptional regulator with XRE-family HTH domain